MIEVVILDKGDFILYYQHFHIGPPKQAITLKAINEFINNELPKTKTHKITIKKWKDSK